MESNFDMIGNKFKFQKHIFRIAPAVKRARAENSLKLSLFNRLFNKFTLINIFFI